MRKAVIILSLIIPLTCLYLLYTGSISWFEVVLGVIVSFFVALLFGDVLVKNPGKIYDPRRWFWLIVYGLKYLTVIEAKAHWQVIKLILNPAKARPGIVRIPYYVDNDYSITTIANSITNTPGTIVVDIDEVSKNMYVHWIEIIDKDDQGARKHVSEEFEHYASKIFE